MNKEVRIWFCDFWPFFNPADNYFTRVLTNNYKLVLDEKNPELVIFSVFGFTHLKYINAIRVQFIGENVRPNYWESDFSLSFDYEDYQSRNLRMPLYVIYGGINQLLEKVTDRNLIQIHPKFCNIVVSNPNSEFRNNFLNKLSGIKLVDSGGTHCNNIGYRVTDKIKFMQDYRFSISFENNSHPGYTTEKIYESMIAGSIPIYWGNELISKEFNENSFINVHNFKNFDQAIEYVVSVENNIELYKDIFTQPWLLPEQIKNYFNEDRLLDFFNSYVFNFKPVPFKFINPKRRLSAYLSVTRKRIYSKYLKRHYSSIQ